MATSKRAKRPTIGELRRIVKSGAAALAAADAFSELEHVLENLGWLQNFTPCTSRRLRDGICLLVDIASRVDVEGAAEAVNLGLTALTTARRKAAV